MARWGVVTYTVTEIGNAATLNIEIEIDQHYIAGSTLHAVAAFRVRCWQLLKMLARVING